MIVEQIEIPNIDNPHPDAMSVHSTGSYGNEDASDTSSNPKKKAPRRRSSLVDPNERHVCKFCEQEMGSRKEKIKHQVSSTLRLNQLRTIKHLFPALDLTICSSSNLLFYVQVLVRQVYTASVYMQLNTSFPVINQKHVIKIDRETILLL